MPDPYATDPSTPVSPLDAATVLEEAADLLLIEGRRTDGYLFEHPEEMDGPYCVVGAVSKAAGLIGADCFFEGYQHPAVVAVARHLGITEKHREHSWGINVGGWNDATADDFEVIDTLRHVAKDLRNGAIGDAGSHDATSAEVGQADG
jgi:hypothetical protein